MKNVLFWMVMVTFTLAGCQDNTSRLDTNTNEQNNPFDSINALIKGEPNKADLYFARAKLHYEHRDLASSLSDIGRALRIDSTRTDYYLLLADLKLINKQSRESKDALLKAHHIDPKNVDVLLKLGELYMIVQDAEKSFEYLNLALQLDVHNATAYRLKGFNYKYLGDTLNAVSSFQTAVEQDPDDYDSYMQLGLLYSIARHPLALDYLNNALKVNPSSIEALYAKGLFLQNTGEPRKALLAYDQIIGINKEYFDAYYNKGYVYLELLNKYDSAAAEFTKVLEFGPPEHFAAIYNRGLACERAGKLKEAEADYRLALKYNPQYDPAALGLSRILD